MAIGRSAGVSWLLRLTLGGDKPQLAAPQVPQVVASAASGWRYSLMSSISASSPRESALDREFLKARLVKKQCLSESAQTYHLEFVLPEVESFSFLPGQFISAVADDLAGKEQTRAYSIASAPDGNKFDLCLNRVAGGFFSNLLADLPDLPLGGDIQIYGPNGFFTLRTPIADSILVATGTGVAPMRGFLQWLFPANGPRPQRRQRDLARLWHSPRN